MVNYQFNGPVEESKTCKNWAQSQATTARFATDVFELQARIASTRFNYEHEIVIAKVISYHILTAKALKSPNREKEGSIAMVCNLAASSEMIDVCRTGWNHKMEPPVYLQTSPPVISLDPGGCTGSKNGYLFSSFPENKRCLGFAMQKDLAAPWQIKSWYLCGIKLADQKASSKRSLLYHCSCCKLCYVYYVILCAYVPCFNQTRIKLSATTALPFCRRCPATPATRRTTGCVAGVLFSL